MKRNKSSIFIRFISIVMLCAFLFACASSAKNVSATYVSPLAYQSYSCDQLREEYLRVTSKVMEISGRQDSAAKKDTVAMTVGMVVFWPALFFLIGGDKSNELARLKGECDAIESSAIQKNCSIAAEIQEARQKQHELQTQKEIEEKKNENFQH